MPFARIDGIIVHYAHRPAQGGAPTILFSNSLGTDFRIWGETAAALPEEIGIVFYDKRGHGLTDLGHGERVDLHVADVAVRRHVRAGRGARSDDRGVRRVRGDRVRIRD